MYILVCTKRLKRKEKHQWRLLDLILRKCSQKNFSVSSCCATIHSTIALVFRKYRWVCVRQCQSQGPKSLKRFLYFRIDRSLINLLSCILIKLIYENKFSFWLNPFLDGFGQLKIGGDETRSGYMRYIQGIQPNVPARITLIDI